MYESNDRGVNWINITGNNLPNLPVNCIVYQGLTNDDLYIGTDVGVYFKDNSMSDWVPFMTGLPNVVVKELEIHYAEGSISAATYGRGVWESPLNTLPSGVIKNELSHFSIYPNPAKNNISFSIESIFNSSLFIRLYSLTGQIMIEKELNSENNTLNISTLSKGCYIVEFDNKIGGLIREKLIKE